MLLNQLFFRCTCLRLKPCRYDGVCIKLLLTLHLVFYALNSDADSVSLDASAIPSPSADFSVYVNELREYLSATQMPQRTSSAVEINLPFELRANTGVDYQGKFLLIHGLNDSPFVWRDIAARLADRGFDVRAILLPGHGNTPKAQLSISFKDWLASAREHVKLYREPDSNFYIGGFSMGGVIATLLATETDFVDGLLLFSPAYRARMHSRLRWAGIYARFKPWVFGGMIIEDNPAKYNSIPINGASQYYKTTRALQRHWPRKALDIPVLVVASDNDSVVDIKHMKRAVQKGFTSAKRVIVYNNQTAPQTPPVDVEYRNARYPDLRILNQSHMSVMIAPDNPLYGIARGVLVCNGNEWVIFSACLRHTGTHWFGAQHTPSPDGVPVARTTFNPDIDYVMQAFDEVFLQPHVKP